MDCIAALFFHRLWKGEQRIPLTSKEVRSMGSLGCWFFFFFNLRGIKIYIGKKLLGFGWIPLDPGNRQWKRRVGASTVQAEKMELQGRGLGPDLWSGTHATKSYTWGFDLPWSEHQRNWRRNGPRNMWQVATEKTGICNYNYLLLVAAKSHIVG